MAVVQLEGNFAGEGPYKGTDFEAAAFAYVVNATKTAESCFGALDPVAGDEQRAVATVWDGLPARRLTARYEVAGTEDSHQIVATFRRGRCYLFETVVVSKNAGGPIRALAPARWKVVQAQVASLMESVRLAAAGRTLSPRP